VQVSTVLVDEYEDYNCFEVSFFFFLSCLRFKNGTKISNYGCVKQSAATRCVMLKKTGVEKSLYGEESLSR
jgi:hypothetical protein